jgi:hypothetical protein
MSSDKQPTQASALHAAAGIRDSAPVSDAHHRVTTLSPLPSAMFGQDKKTGGGPAVDRYGKQCVSVVKNTRSEEHGITGPFTRHEMLVHNNCDVPVVVQFVQNVGDDFGTWQVTPGGEFKRFCTTGYLGQPDCHGYKGFRAHLP